jgi:hypothetical protein
LIDYVYLNSGANLNTGQLLRYGSQVAFAQISQAEILVTDTCTAEDLYVKLTAAPGGSRTRRFEVYQNGTGTGLFVDLGPGVTMNSETGITASLNPNDLISLRNTVMGTGPLTAAVAAVTFKLVYT